MHLLLTREARPKDGVAFGGYNSYQQFIIVVGMIYRLILNRDYPESSVIGYEKMWKPTM